METDPFAALSPAQRGARRVAVVLYLFDLLHLDGQDTTALPLRTRKRLLGGAIAVGGPLRRTPHRLRDREALLAGACRRGWEGPIAGRADAPYAHRRSPDWVTLKLKCSAEQELVAEVVRE